MNVIINVPSQQNILFTLDELMVVIMVREKKTPKTVRLVCWCICVGEKNYMANYLSRHQTILSARVELIQSFL